MAAGSAMVQPVGKGSAPPAPTSAPTRATVISQRLQQRFESPAARPETSTPDSSDIISRSKAIWQNNFDHHLNQNALGISPAPVKFEVHRGKLVPAGSANLLSQLQSGKISPPPEHDENPEPVLVVEPPPRNPLRQLQQHQLRDCQLPICRPTSSIYPDDEEDSGAPGDCGAAAPDKMDARPVLEQISPPSSPSLIDGNEGPMLHDVSPIDEETDNARLEMMRNQHPAPAPRRSSLVPVAKSPQQRSNIPTMRRERRAQEAAMRPSGRGARPPMEHGRGGPPPPGHRPLPRSDGTRWDGTGTPMYHGQGHSYSHSQSSHPDSHRPRQPSAGYNMPQEIPRGRQPSGGRSTPTGHPQGRSGLPSYSQGRATPTGNPQGRGGPMPPVGAPQRRGPPAPGSPRQSAPTGFQQQGRSTPVESRGRSTPTGFQQQQQGRNTPVEMQGRNTPAGFQQQGRSTPVEDQGGSTPTGFQQQGRSTPVEAQGRSTPTGFQQQQQGRSTPTIDFDSGRSTPDSQFGFTTTITGPATSRSRNASPSLGQRVKQLGRGGKPEPVESRPAWNGASGRTTLVQPVHDDPEAPALKVPEKSKKKSGGRGISLASALLPGQSSNSNSGSSEPSTTIRAFRKFMPSRNTDKSDKTANRGSPDPPPASQSYPSPPQESISPEPDHTLQSNVGDAGVGGVRVVVPTPTDTPPSSNKAIKRKPPPTTSTIVTVSSPTHSPTALETSARPAKSRAAENSENADSWVQPSSRFSITTYATSNAGSPRQSNEEDRPPMPTPPPQASSIMDRSRPRYTDPNKSGDASGEPIVLSMSSPYQRQGGERKAAGKTSKKTLGEEDVADRRASIISTSKALPPLPPELVADDRIANLNGKLESLAHRRVNIIKSIKQMTELMPQDSLMASSEVLRKRDLEKQKVEVLRAELADVQQEEYNLGLKLHRAYKRQDRDGDFDSAALWVRRVTE